MSDLYAKIKCFCMKIRREVVEIEEDKNQEVKKISPRSYTETQRIKEEKRVDL